MPVEKHFLDTSVLRPILLGSTAYKRYFADHFSNGRKYVSKYVLMEFKRSYLRNILNFYFVLDLPSIETISDAIAFWSNKFKTSELKAIIQFVAQIVISFKLMDNNPKDKEKALKEIGRYVKRLEMKIRRQFLDIGKNETQCHRSLIKFIHSDDMTLMFKDFLRNFNDVQLCRSKCIIDSYIIDKYKVIVNRIVNNADKINNPTKMENIGFKKISDNLKEATNDKDKFSCHFCEKIGDSVIAIESPIDMQLEHTDHSFDHLCQIIGQPHFKHLSEIAFLNLLTNK